MREKEGKKRKTPNETKCEKRVIVTNRFVSFHFLFCASASLLVYGCVKVYKQTETFRTWISVLSSLQNSLLLSLSLCLADQAERSIDDEPIARTHHSLLQEVWVKNVYFWTCNIKQIRIILFLTLLLFSFFLSCLNSRLSSFFPLLRRQKLESLKHDEMMMVVEVMVAVAVVAMMKTRRELCEFAFVVATIVILSKREIWIKLAQRREEKKKRTNDSGATIACNLSVKILIKYCGEEEKTSKTKENGWKRHTHDDLLAFCSFIKRNNFDSMSLVATNKDSVNSKGITTA